MKRIYIILVLALTLISSEMNGQQIPVYSQYVMNGFLVNPSLAGRDGYTTVNLTARQQWIGIKGAPSSYAASYQSTLLRNSFISKGHSVKRRPSRPTKPSRVGLGGYIFNDNNGIIRRTGFQFSYGYHIPMAKNKIGEDDLSLGLSMVTYQHALKTNDLENNYDDDPYFSTYDKSVFITDFNFGASFTSTNYYVGFAMTNILRGSLIYGNSADYKRGELGHYIITGGYKYSINKDWALKPSAYIRASDLLLKSVQMDLTARVFYKESYWGGVSYRTGNAVIMMLGMKYDKYFFGYSYDIVLSDIRKNTFGSMEFIVAAKFGESSRRYRWLNEF